MTEYSTVRKPWVFSGTERGCLRGNRCRMLPTRYRGWAHRGRLVGTNPGDGGGGGGGGLLPGRRCLGRAGGQGRARARDAPRGPSPAPRRRRTSRGRRPSRAPGQPSHPLRRPLDSYPRSTHHQPLSEPRRQRRALRKLRASHHRAPAGGPRLERPRQTTGSRGWELSGAAPLSPGVGTVVLPCGR